MRNNLQLVYAMLNKHVQAADGAAKEDISAIARRVMTPGQGLRPSPQRQADANHRFWSLPLVALRPFQRNMENAEHRDVTLTLSRAFLDA